MGPSPSVCDVNKKLPLHLIFNLFQNTRSGYSCTTRLTICGTPPETLFKANRQKEFSLVAISLFFENKIITFAFILEKVRKKFGPVSVLVTKTKLA